MSGHSKWATIKRKKGEADAKKGKVFTKLVREITTAARIGGGDPGGNPRLRAAIAAGKSQSMPADNIERAIKKGTGALEGPPVEETVYEGYGPLGVAVLIEAQTDNRNRTIADVRAAFAKAGGNMGTAGSVAWMFKSIGVIAFDAARMSEEKALAIGLEHGVADVRTEGDVVVMECAFQDFAQLLTAVENDATPFLQAELTQVADTLVTVAGDDVVRLERLVERLEDLDDVAKVFTNARIENAQP